MLTFGHGLDLDLGMNMPIQWPRGQPLDPCSIQLLIKQMPSILLNYVSLGQMSKVKASH
jgi:hypothetical protein